MASHFVLLSLLLTPHLLLGAYSQTRDIADKLPQRKQGFYSSANQYNRYWPLYYDRYPQQPTVQSRSNGISIIQILVSFLLALATSGRTGRSGTVETDTVATISPTTGQSETTTLAPIMTTETECSWGPWGRCSTECLGVRSRVKTCSGVTEIETENCNVYTRSCIRLADGVTPNSGRIEIYYDNAWGTVCDDGFDQIDADTACRQLGFSSASSILTGTDVVDGSGPMWTRNLECTGLEASIQQCHTDDAWGDVSCGHHEDVGVVCA